MAGWIGLQLGSLPAAGPPAHLLHASSYSTAPPSIRDFIQLLTFLRRPPAKMPKASDAGSHTARPAPLSPAAAAAAAAANDSADLGCARHRRGRGRDGSGNSRSVGGNSSGAVACAPGCLPMATCAQQSGQSCAYTQCETLNRKAACSGHQGAWLAGNVREWGQCGAEVGERPQKCCSLNVCVCVCVCVNQACCVDT